MCSSYTFNLWDCGTRPSVAENGKNPAATCPTCLLVWAVVPPNIRTCNFSQSSRLFMSQTMVKTYLHPMITRPISGLP